MIPQVRMRRLRISQKIRKLATEITLTQKNLIYPIFVEEGIKSRKAIESMPGQFRLPLEEIVQEGKAVSSLGIPAVILFGIPERKDEKASSAYDSNGVVQQAVRTLKNELETELVIITDVCLCQYTTHGHCGIVGDKGEILNDTSLEILEKIAVSHAEAGVDVVAPSAMMDGQVQAIRKALDQAGFLDVAILAYSAKYASSLYRPFREAAHSTPSFGDRKSYQMDYATETQAIREVELDIKEGADMVMVKPALPYLDVIYRVKKRFGLPTVAYQVSGEYSMIKAAAERGWIDEKATVIEVLTAIKRAGADMIMTYFAKDASRWLTEK